MATLGINPQLLLYICTMSFLYVTAVMASIVDVEHSKNLISARIKQGDDIESQ